MMLPIIEKFMEVGKKGRGRELTFPEHGIIVDALESQDRIAYPFLLPIIWVEGCNSSMKICQMMK